MLQSSKKIEFREGKHITPEYAMWPYTETETEWTSADAVRSQANETITPSPEMIDFYIKRGHSMRALALRDMIVATTDAVRKLFHDRLQPIMQRRVAHH